MIIYTVTYYGKQIIRAVERLSFTCFVIANCIFYITMADAVEDSNTHDVMDNIDEDKAAIITVLSKGNVQYKSCCPVYCAKLLEVRIQYLWFGPS